METAKVDIRKLQLLNDRINQTIDALSQVRLSVHGLSHTAGINPTLNPGDPRLQLQGGLPQMQQGGFPQLFGGLSHTPQFFGGPQMGFNPYAALGGVPAGVNPFIGWSGGQGIGVNPFAGFSGFQGGMNPYGVPVGQFGGLSHSSGVESPEAYLRPTWSDPLLAARVAQTFPYVQYAVPPVVSLY
jgi:hypothetical protein